MITVDTRVYTQNPYMTDYTHKISTHTVNGPNLTVSKLSGKTKVKTALEAHNWDNLACKSTITGVYA